ncbi:1-acyl-sn-glycerol-3-phosphate acyltransferase, partial [Streptomyces sp. OfavH-34-F]|uniref:lysophospholipid acyltransferase family protein n=1 Tax=Streptomyces sp. OfavH-34-F TaxID=2917760 RepID=UPI001EF394B2
MLSRCAGQLVPAFGRLTLSTDEEAALPPAGIIAANHTSLADPAVVLAALRRLGARPVIMATAGLWRVPLLGRALAREGHIPVHRGDPRAARSVELAQRALEQGRHLLIYAEGGLPLRDDA